MPVVVGGGAVNSRVAASVRPLRDVGVRHGDCWRRRHVGRAVEGEAKGSSTSLVGVSGARRRALRFETESGAGGEGVPAD
jgi:hypothetical protein